MDGDAGVTVHALFSKDEAPRRLLYRPPYGDDECGQFSGYCGFPLPQTVVVFIAGAMEDVAASARFVVTLSIGSEIAPRELGSFGKDVRCLCTDIHWSVEELRVAKEVESRDGLAKLVVRAEGYSPDASARHLAQLGLMSPVSAVSGYLSQQLTQSPTSVSLAMTAALSRGAKADSGSPTCPPDSGHSSPADQHLGARAHTHANALSPLAGLAKKASSKQSAKRSGDASVARPQKRRSIAETVEATVAIADGAVPNDGAAIPTARWGHVFVPLGRGRYIMHGGQGPKQEMARDDLWMYSAESGEWRAVVAGGTPPASRMGHTAVYVQDRASVYVFGGSKNLRWFNDMYALAIEDDAAAAEWTLVKSLGKSPTSAYHSCTVFRDELYVFGGVHGHQSARIPDTCSNTVHVFTPATSTWYEPLVTGTKPCPRSGHSATLVGEQLIIFGGWDSPTCFGDLFILDLVMMEFTQPQTSGSPPSPRSWHSAVALPDRKIVVSGGFDGENSLDDAHILDLDTMAWSALSPSSEIFRRPRAGHVTCLATSEVASGAPAVVVSGGGDNNDFFYPGAQTVPVSLVLS